MQKENITYPEEIEISKDLIIDKSVCIYGPSGTGKSAIIASMLYTLQQHVPQIIVFCPTDRENKTYSKSMVPLPLIHYSLDEDLLRSIWSRQEVLTQIYSRVNDINTLRRIYEKLQLKDMDSVLQKIQSTKAETVLKIREQYLDVNVRDKKIEEIEERYKEFFSLVYKHNILKHKSQLSNLSAEESFVIKHIDINPKMVIVFDDCSAELAKIKTKEGKKILGDMFFQGRHQHITVLMAVHDDKLLDTEFRKNAYISIFTHNLVANAFFGRSSNGFSKDIVKKITLWQDTIFQGYQKLIYVRLEAKFYRFTVKKRDNFTFGCEIVKEYCRIIQADKNQMDTANEFYKFFRDTT